MENTSPIALEVISDEEVGFGDTRKDNSYGGGGFGDCEDHNWLSKLLSELDRNKAADDSDDVVVVSEVFASSKKSKLGRGENCAKIVVDDDDDDCVVLDGDPEKSVVVVVESGKADGDGDSDDLEIIGEKGEVACRDFPHPRHLCANHPFASTSHDLHCAQCHCYVCDSLAPCASWGTGTSSIDHCHASDKDERWKTERKLVKKLNNPRPVLPRTIDTYFSPQLHQTPQIPQLAPPPVPPSSLLLNQGLELINIPNVVNQGRRHPYGCVVPRCKRQPQLVPEQLQTTCHNNIPSRNKTGNSGPRFISPRAVFKRSASIGVSPNYVKNSYGYPLPRDPSLRRCHSFPNPGSNCHYSSNEQNTLSEAARAVPQISQSINVTSVNYSYSQPQRTPQPCLSGNYVNMTPFQSHVESQPNLGKFQNMVISQPDIVSKLNNPISPHQSTSNTFEKKSSQFEAFGNSTSLLIDGQNNFPQGGQSESQSSVDTKATDFSYDWHASQLQSAAPADNSQFQSMIEDAYGQSISAAHIDNTTLVKDIDFQISESRNPDLLGFVSDSWAFEDEDVYFPEARDILWAAGKNPDLFL